MAVQDPKARRRRRLALLLERPPKSVKVICALPAFLLAVDVGRAAFSLLNNGREAIGGGHAVVGTCTRDPASGWLLYRCALRKPDGSLIESSLPGTDELKALRRPHGEIDFEIRKTSKSKAGQGYVMVEKGTPRHSVLVQMLAIPVFIAVFITVFTAVLGVLRLAAKVVRPGNADS